MAILSSRKIHHLFNIACNGSTTTEQGRSLEDLVCYIFGKIPGISITHRDQLNTFRSEEIDVALWNEKRSHTLDFLPNVILVEAKNWSNPVGSSEVAWFDRKLQNRGLDFGILIALRGITGNAEERTSAHQIIAQSLCDRRRIVILTSNDIETLRDTFSLVTLVKTRLCELAVTGTLFP